MFRQISVFSKQLSFLTCSSCLFTSNLVLKPRTSHLRSMKILFLGRLFNSDCAVIYPMIALTPTLLTIGAKNPLKKESAIFSIKFLIYFSVFNFHILIFSIVIKHTLKILSFTCLIVRYFNPIER